MKKKSDVLSKFRRYIQDMRTIKSDFSIKKLRTDRGGEYLNDKMEEFLRKKGIYHEKTAADSPETNGTAERMNRTLTEMARAWMIDSGLDGKFWLEAVKHATLIHNRLPTKGNDEGKSP